MTSDQEERRPGQIVGWTMGAPDTWGSWTPRQGAAAADAVAADLADGSDAQARVRESVLALDGGLPAQAALFTVGLWVPDRTTGEVCGALVAQLLVDVPAGEDPVGAMLASTSGAPGRREQKRLGIRVLESGADRTEVPAGPTLVETRTWADTSSKAVTSTIVCTVVPAGATEAFSVEFSTTVPGLHDALTDQAGVILGHLDLEVA